MLIFLQHAPTEYLGREEEICVKPKNKDKRQKDDPKNYKLNSHILFHMPTRSRRVPHSLPEAEFVDICPHPVAVVVEWCVFL